jgi:molybdate transport system regulatory protein
MNTLHGHITSITTEQNISLVKGLAEGHLFHSLILDTPATSPWLKESAPIRVLFKETEVMIALPPLQISVRNQLPCRITAITAGAILCELTLSLTATSSIVSIITRSACESLGLKENQDVIALIKTNEVSLAHD